MSTNTARYWDVILKRIGVILLCLLAGGGVAGGYLVITPATYSASAYVRVDMLSDAQDPATLMLASQALLYTAATAARSDSVTSQVATQVSGVTAVQVRTSITAAPVPSSDLLQIEAGAPSAALATQLANADAAALIDVETRAIQQENTTRESALTSQLATSNAKLADLRNQLAALRARGVPSTDPQVTALTGEIADQASTSQTLSTSLAQLQLTESQDAPFLRMQQAARAEDAVLAPNALKVVPAGALAGALVGLLLATLFGLRDRRIRSVAEIQRMLDASLVMHDIPHESAPGGGLVPFARPMSGGAATDAFTGLRADLDLLAVSRPLRVLAVSGSAPQAGTTFTAASLAEFWASMGKQVALVDAHLDRPSLHARYHVPNTAGLAEAIAAVDTPGWNAGAYLHPTPTPLLSLIPAGIRTSRQADLLASPAMGRVLDALRLTNAEIVIVDLPPAAPGTGALSLAERADGLALVIDRDQASFHGIEQLTAILAQEQVNLVALLLNAPGTSARARQERADRGAGAQDASQLGPVAMSTRAARRE
jgi:tyrosine-protein kinase Etk/Wzc